MSAQKANILVIGDGAREHAICWKLRQSQKVGTIYSTSNNAGITEIATIIPPERAHLAKLLAFAKDSVELTIVSQERLLASGIVDAFEAKGLRIFGPTEAATIIESWKAYAKRFMRGHGIPTAPFTIFEEPRQTVQAICRKKLPFVVKASELADGKGVIVCKTYVDAELACRMVEERARQGNNETIIEDFLEGQEISIHAFCDGKTATLFPPAQDHKTLYDNDKGPNTGGMGAVAPVPWVSKSLMETIRLTIVEKTLVGLAKAKTPFVGCLYPGLKGKNVLEFNARLGDPETQVYMRLLKTDLLDVLDACVDGTLNKLLIEWHSSYAVCVVLASEGYPGKAKIGVPIYGLEEAAQIPNIEIFHAWTKRQGNHPYTAGGRVVSVTAKEDTLTNAIALAYHAVRLIKFDGMHYRKDIGAKALNS